MRLQLHGIAVLLAAAGLALLPWPTQAAAPERCTWTPRSMVAARETDESRVADWIVRRILRLAADSGPVVEISPGEVTAATGVDVSRIDAEQVGRQVRERLRELSREHAGARDSSAVDRVPDATETPAGDARGAPETRQ